MSKLDGYPIPKLDNLYTKLVGGQTFTKLDLSHAGTDAGMQRGFILLKRN